MNIVIKQRIHQYSMASPANVDFVIWRSKFFIDLIRHAALHVTLTACRSVYVGSFISWAVCTSLMNLQHAAEFIGSHIRVLSLLFISTRPRTRTISCPYARFVRRVRQTCSAWLKSPVSQLLFTGRLGNTERASSEAHRLSVLDS